MAVEPAASAAGTEAAAEHAGSLAWFREHAVPLRSAEPGSGLDDLEPLRQMIGGARVVSLGEATHGTREFFQLKHRILEYCVTELGFNLFGIEASLPEAMAVNAYVLHGEGDPGDAIASMRFWTWDTEEVLDLVRWMRAWNETHERKVEFWGFDMQFPTLACQHVLDHLGRSDPELRRELEPALLPLANDFDALNWKLRPAEVREAAAAAIQRALAAVRDDPVARLHAAVLDQGERQHRDQFEAYSVRDLSMAENVRSILELKGPDARIVLWAHNAHVGRDAYRSLGVDSMGTHLHRWFGDQHVVLGFAFGRGAFQAIDAQTRALTDHVVQEPPQGSLDRLLEQLDDQVLLVDLRHAPEVPTLSRSIGALFGERQGNQFMTRHDPRSMYDLLIYVRETKAARRRVTAERPAPEQVEPRPEYSPDAWTLERQRARGAYEAHVESGAARISREGSPWRWGAGRLQQVVEARPLRGRRVRLSGRARLLSGATGAQAKLSLAAGTAAGTVVEAVDGVAATNGWVGLAAELEVPDEADRLTATLALTGDGEAEFADLELRPAREISPGHVARLAAVGELWGAVTLFHPRVVLDPEFDFDAAVLQELPGLVEDGSAERFRDVIGNLVRAADGELAAAERPPGEGPADSGAPLVSEPAPGVKVLSMSRAADLWSAGQAIAQAFGELEAAEKIVLDLRGAGFYQLLMGLYPQVGRLLTEDISLPSVATREHRGFASPGPASPGAYHSSLALSESAEISAQPGPLSAKPLVVITGGDWNGWQLAQTLRAAGRCRVVLEGGVPAAMHELELVDGIRVRVPVAELVLPGGGAAGADAIAESPGDSLPAALSLLGDGAPEPPSGEQGSLVPRRRRPAWAAADGSVPSVEMRLLGLFQMWNVIRSFFPYLELCDEPWGGVLQEFIPRFIEAGDAVRYWRAAAAAYTRTQDSHCMVSGAAQAEHLGTHVPGIALREIEGVSVVIQVAEGVTDVVVGDVLLTVDGEPVAQRAARLGALLPASTPQAHAWKIQQFLLRGAADTQVRLRVSREDGGWSRVELPRDRPHMLFERQGPLFQVLPEGIGYIDTVRLQVSAVTEAMEAVAGCPALILDLRGYPRGTAWQVAAHLTTDQPVAARFRRSDPATPEARARSLTEFEQLTLPPAHSDRRYDGRIAVLIDESAISHAEHSCLFLKASRPDLVFIGSATNGANGDVTSMSLPGGLRATFSGQGVWWPDGTQLQRSGVQPDVEVRPTLAGVRAGRDEVLEAAVAALGAG